MTTKKIIAAAVAALALVSNANATGIPVFDAGNLTQNITNHLESIAKYVEQINQLKSQLEQAKAMFNSMNGVRGMAGLLNNPTARQYLPKEASQIYTIATNAGGGKYSGLSGSAKAIRDAAAVMTAARTAGNTELLTKQQNVLAGMQASAEAAFNAAGQRFEQLQTFVDQVDVATDPKAAQDLQNRIQAEQVMMQNEMMKLQMMKQLQDIQVAQMKQQQREATAKLGGGDPVYATFQ